MRLNYKLDTKLLKKQNFVKSRNFYVAKNAATVNI